MRGESKRENWRENEGKSEKIIERKNTCGGRRLILGFGLSSVRRRGFRSAIVYSATVLYFNATSVTPSFPQENAASVTVGSLFWVEDPDLAWIDGEVEQVNGEEIEIKCTNEKTVVVKVSDVYPRDPEFPEGGVDDMTKLAYLHEPGVLQNLKCRYDIDEIYTYTGNILIAVNPFRRLPHLYDNHMKEKYKGAAFGELDPHPFAVADSAFRQMINEGISQAILVSGESGAGKTESTKMLMQYLAFLGGRAAAEGRSVEQQVLESNPVLEAFGNAKTVRNNNSSRFGKFVEIQFDQRGRISGAAIRTYLLERSRVCQLSDPERNYHCFYMLCAAPPEDVEKYKLGNPRTFHYLNQSNFYELEGVDESKEYLTTRRAMEVVGISLEEQDAIFQVVAAILHLGNIEFVKGQEIDSSEPKDDNSRFHLKTAAELFMCDEKALEDSLCKRVIVTRDESITKSLDPDSAALSRDALARTVYSRLFDWIVNKINNSIGQDPDSKSLIGVLDIYGFESFKTNSFEQFCINLTNEKLQQHFNQHVFKMEQEEYTKEEIDWSYIEFIDNQDVLDLIEKKPGGIIALLDEACMFPRSTHETFAQKLYQTFKDHKRFSKPKLAPSDFTIYHYAGEVTYQTEHFLDKNKDYVVAEHEALLSASKCSFVSGLFPPSPEESVKSSKFSSIGSRFKQQLQSLLETLSATEPHYIRCVKPNNALKPSIFENNNVLHQLRCGGVMEAIRISCAGYPTRKMFHEFIARFGILAPNAVKGSNDEVTTCKRILEKVNLKGYQVGKTKVFLRAGQMAELDARRIEVLGRSASIIQRKVCTYFARKHFLLLRLSSIQIQALCRGQVAHHQYEYKRREAASLKIQKNSRMFLARKVYKNLYFSAISIQTGMRRMAAWNELIFRKQTRAATIIQSQCRQYLGRFHYLKLRKAAITTQCAWRVKVARRELRKLKMAAKEAGALKEANIKLEKEVEELNCCLQIEKQMRSDLEEAKNQESAKLQSALQEMQLQLEENAKLLKEVQLQSEENTKLKAALEEMQLQLDENTKLKSALEEIQLQSEENEKLKSALVEMQLQLEENAKLKSALGEMQLQSEENARLKSALEKEMQLQSEENAKLKLALEEVQLHHENAKLKSALEVEMQLQSEENAKLKSALEDMQLQLQETKELLAKEGVAAKKLAELVPVFQESEATKNVTEDVTVIQEHEPAKEVADHVPVTQESKAAMEVAEHVPVIQEVPIFDNEFMARLAAENEELKAQVSSLEKKIDETEMKFDETNKLSEERLKQALDAELKIIALKTSMQKLEEKISDMEAEDHVLQQQALLNTQVSRKMSGRFSFSTSVKRQENGHLEPQNSFLRKKLGTDSMRKSQIGPLQETVDALITCVTENVGFDKGVPVAAFTIYKCLLNWKSFESERTSVFDRLIQMISSAIEEHDDKNDHLAYWLSNTSALLFLLQRSLKGNIASGSSSQLPPAPTSFFGRMAQGFRSSSANLAVDVVRQVEAKYPALLFKQQLAVFVEKIYGIIRENLKKELVPIISSCMQASKASKVTASPSSEGSVGNGTAVSHWSGIIECLDRLLSTLKDNFVPPILVQKIFARIFSIINVNLFNSLLLRRESCTFSNGEYVKSGLAELELWCGQATEEYTAAAWDELKHTRQAIGFLVIHQKSKISYNEITNELCPLLSVQQLYRICTLYRDDDFNTPSVSQDVISSLKVLVTDESSGDDGNSFLLEEDLSLLFSIEDISGAFQLKDFAEVKAPPELLYNPYFHFLQE
ncbi:hypothetical protein SLA2020_212130 [Shorea laevis]